MNTPSAHHRSCQAQMDGIPNVQVAKSFGLPKIVLPITAPGPIPKKNHTSVMIHATGTRPLLGGRQ